MDILKKNGNPYFIKDTVSSWIKELKKKSLSDCYYKLKDLCLEKSQGTKFAQEKNWICFKNMHHLIILSEAVGERKNSFP